MADNNRKSSRKYDLEKTPSRSFDLNKDESSGSPIKVSGEKSKRKVVTVLCIVACAIVTCVIWWIVGGNNTNKAGEKQIAETTETQTVQENTPSSDLEVENVAEATESNNQTTQIADNTTTDVSVPSTDNPENVQPTDPIVAENSTPNVSENKTPEVETPEVRTTPTHPTETTPKINASSNNTSENMSEEYIEKMARTVIRGDYGNGQERKDKLGDEYERIQSKVNDLYRKRDFYGI